MKALRATARGLRAVLVFLVRMVLHLPPEKRSHAASHGKATDEAKDQA